MCGVRPLWVGFLSCWIRMMVTFLLHCNSGKKHFASLSLGLLIVKMRNWANCSSGSFSRIRICDYLLLDRNIMWLIISKLEKIKMASVAEKRHYILSFQAAVGCCQLKSYIPISLNCQAFKRCLLLFISATHTHAIFSTVHCEIISGLEKI